jgi:hypothetical protein
MSIAGNWKITVNAPTGAMSSLADFTEDGAVLTGSVTDPDNVVQAIKDGVIQGDKAKWKMDITKPLPMTLSFSATIAPDTLSGTVAAGPFGSFPFSGVRP